MKENFEGDITFETHYKEETTEKAYRYHCPKVKELSKTWLFKTEEQRVRSYFFGSGTYVTSGLKAGLFT